MSSELDKLAQVMGFLDEGELNRMVAAVDLSTPAKQRAFQTWKEFDGSKEGLKKLLGEEEKETPSPLAGHTHYIQKSQPCPLCRLDKAAGKITKLRTLVNAVRLPDTTVVTMSVPQSVLDLGRAAGLINEILNDLQIEVKE